MWAMAQKASPATIQYIPLITKRVQMQDITKAQKIGLILKHGGNDDDEVLRIASQISAYLVERFGGFIISENDRHAFDSDKTQAFPFEEVPKHCDIVIVVGGDGTLLKISHPCAEHNTPVIGINLGRLGFLVEIAPDKFRDELEKIFSGSYKIEERTMLEAAHLRNQKVLDRFIACNDVAIRNKDTVRMVELDTTINNVFLNTVWSDGLIIATPTGSTAYALSSGGPLIEPTMEATLLVPICPHTLSHRPLVVDSKKIIEVTVSPEHQSDAVFAIDGQITRDLMAGDTVVIKSLSNKLQLIQPFAHNYFSTLRTKLKWSEKL